MRYVIGAMAVAVVFVVVAAVRWKATGANGSKPSWDRTTAAYRAINAGDATKLKAMLADGLDANFVCGDMTMLHAAAALCQRECVKVLLAAGAKVDAQDAAGRTPLCRAVDSNVRRITDDSGAETVQLMGQGIAKILLAAGANPNLATAKGQTPLHWAAYHGSAETVATLLSAGALADTKDADGESPLVWALRDGGSSAIVPVVDLLLKAKADPGARDKAGLPLLHLACRAEAPPIVERILKAGVGVNSVDVRGRSALWVAAASDSPKCIKVLLAAGADVNLRDKEGKPPLAAAAMGGNPMCLPPLRAAGASEVSWTPLHWAAILGEGQVGGDQALAKAALDARDAYGYTPLIYAAARGAEKLVRTLLAAGAEVGLAAADKVTALIAACRADRGPTAKALIEARSPVNARDADGWTPLLLAVKARDAETIGLLLDAKADPLARDKDDRQPIDLMDVKGGKVHDRLESAMALANDELLDSLLAAAGKDTAPPGPAKTPQDALRNYARALYRMDKPAQLACMAQGKADQRLAETMAECMEQGFAFRRAMIAAYGLAGWRKWRDGDDGVKGDIKFPLYDAEAIRTAQITITGDAAVYEQPERLQGQGQIGFVREGGQWRVRLVSSLGSDADGQKLAKLLTDFVASMRELRSEIGKPGVTAQDINRRLGLKVFEQMGFRFAPR